MSSVQHTHPTFDQILDEKKCVLYTRHYCTNLREVGDNSDLRLSTDLREVGDNSDLRLSTDLREVGD